MAGNEGGTTEVTLNHLQGFLAKKVVVIFPRGGSKGERVVGVYISKTSLHSGHFGPLGPFWAPLGLMKPFFGDPRRPSDVLHFLMFFRILFCSVFGSTWVHLGLQEGAKIDQKSIKLRSQN